MSRQQRICRQRRASSKSHLLMALQTVLQLLQQNAEKELLRDEADQVVNFHLA